MIAWASNIQSKKTSPWGNDTQIQYNNSGAFAWAWLEYIEPYTNAYGLKAPDQPTIDNDWNHLAFQATWANWIGDWGYVWFEAWNADTNWDWGYTYMGGGQWGSIWWNGGNAQLYGWNAIAWDWDWGRVEITWWSADWVWTGWDVKIIPWSSPSWTPWVIRLGNPWGTFFANLDTSGISAERAITLQDWDGTLAFLSDITGGLKLPTYTVGASGADYTDIQSALDAWNWLIYLTDSTYTITTGLKFKFNYQYIIGNGEKCIIQFNGATVATAISPNATNLKQWGIKGVSIQQTNPTIQGTALDLSDMALMDIDVEIKDAGVALKMNDANNNTFYNTVYIRAFGCTRWIELNWTNPSNNNYFSGRIANKSGGDYGVYITKWQGNRFEDLSLEPAATTGNTWIYLTSASTYANTFENVWIEGNNVWVTIDSSVTYNTFIWGTITANTTNLTDNGKQTAFYNTQVGSVQRTNINPWTVVDNGNASDIAWNIKNNTSFAHVWGALVETELRNWSDTSILNRWKNAGSWKYVSALNGATEYFSVNASGKGYFKWGVQLTDSSTSWYVWTATDTSWNGSWQAWGGGGGAWVTEVEVDFWTTPVTSKKFTITNGSITTSSNIIVSPSWKTATWRVWNDAEWESYSLSARPWTWTFELAVVSHWHVKWKRKFLYTYS